MKKHLFIFLSLLILTACEKQNEPNAIIKSTPPKTDNREQLYGAYDGTLYWLHKEGNNQVVDTFATTVRVKQTDHFDPNEHDNELAMISVEIPLYHATPLFPSSTVTYWPVEIRDLPDLPDSLNFKEKLIKLNDSAMVSGLFQGQLLLLDFIDFSLPEPLDYQFVLTKR